MKPKKKSEEKDLKNIAMSKIALPIAILLVFLYASESVDGAKLIFTHVICRHGDRNPFTPCKGCPYRSAKHWLGGYGALTKKGWGQHKRLGRWFRRRYRSLLINGNYTPNLVYIKSTVRSNIFICNKCICIVQLSQSLNSHFISVI